MLTQIWKRAKVPIFVLPYDIMVLSPVACLIETVIDSVSIHQFKKEHPDQSLCQYFEERYDGPDSQAFLEVRCNFIDSLVGYSLLCYVLQVKDRHNGNILIRDNGHLVHIDFGFMLANSPGGLNWESEFFKLTSEYVEMMGGLHSPMWEYFKASMLTGFLQLRQSAEEIIGIVRCMRSACVATGTLLPCLQGGPSVIERLRERFKLDLGPREVAEFVDGMIDEALNTWRTRQYDSFQYYTNGYLY